MKLPLTLIHNPDLSKINIFLVNIKKKYLNQRPLANQKMTKHKTEQIARLEHNVYSYIYVCDRLFPSHFPSGSA